MAASIIYLFTFEISADIRTSVEQPQKRSLAGVATAGMEQAGKRVEKGPA